jgi:choline dehydrogenase-like flavoprotein
MCSTIRMGKQGDETSCVDTRFRVNGVENLRVVDLSILPLLPKYTFSCTSGGQADSRNSNHTQSTAYLVGETAAEKLIEEYGLGTSKN